MKPFSKEALIGVSLVSLIFVVAPFYFHPNAGGVGLEIPFNISTWFITVGFIWWGVSHTYKKGNLLFPRGYLLLIQLIPAFIFAALLSGVDLPLAWLLRLAFIAGGLVFCFFLAQVELNEEQRNLILVAVVISGLFHSVLTIVQLEAPSLLDTTYLSTLDTISSTFQQANNLSTYLATCFLISLYLISEKIGLKSRSLRLLIPASSATSLYVILIENSQVAILVTVAIGSISLIKLIYSLRKQMLRGLYVISVITAAVGLAYANKDYSVEQSEIESTSFWGSERQEIYDISFHLVKQSPWLGYGVGSFPKVWQAEKAARWLNQEQPSHINTLVTHPHNEVLFWQIELGVLATISISIFCLGMILILVRAGIGYLLFVTPVLAHNMVELPFHTSALHWLLIMLFIGLALQKQRGKLVSINRVFSNVRILGHTFFLSLLFMLGHAMYVSSQFAFSIPSIFNAGLSNPLTQRQSEKIMYKQLLLQESKLENEHAYEIFVEWANSELQNNPHPALYYDQVLALRKLGLLERSCKVLSQAVSIYPKNKALHTKQRDCYN